MPAAFQQRKFVLAIDGSVRDWALKRGGREIIEVSGMKLGSQTLEKNTGDTVVPQRSLDSWNRY